MARDIDNVASFLNRQEFVYSLQVCQAWKQVFDTEYGWFYQVFHWFVAAIAKVPLTILTEVQKQHYTGLLRTNWLEMGRHVIWRRQLYKMLSSCYDVEYCFYNNATKKTLTFCDFDRHCGVNQLHPVHMAWLCDVENKKVFPDPFLQGLEEQDHIEKEFIKELTIAASLRHSFCIHQRYFNNVTGKDANMEVVNHFPVDSDPGCENRASCCFWLNSEFWIESLPNSAVHFKPIDCYFSFSAGIVANNKLALSVLLDLVPRLSQNLRQHSILYKRRASTTDESNLNVIGSDCFCFWRCTHCSKYSGPGVIRSYITKCQQCGGNNEWDLTCQDCATQNSTICRTCKILPTFSLPPKKRQRLQVPDELHEANVNWDINKFEELNCPSS